MTDLKIATGTVEIVQYGPATIATNTGLTFITVPADADLAEVKVWSAGGGGGGRGESAVAKAGDGGGGGFIHARNIPVIPGEDMVLVVGVGGAGGVGSTGAGESGDGGGGGGRSHAAKFPSIVTICGAGGGGGGGGVSSGATVASQFGGAGGPGGGDVGGDGTRSIGPYPSASTVGRGGTLVAGGAGGSALGSGGDGDDGVSIAGGDGGHKSGGLGDGLNASGGTPGGGDGGAYRGGGGGAGGGGNGHFGGGGGAAGDDIGVPEPGTGGGGGSGFFTPGSILIETAQGVGINGAGQSDPDYPGGLVGMGGLGGLVADNGGVGFGGAVLIRFGTLATVSTVNDIVMDGDSPATVEGVDLIAQHVRAILLICQGEWFLDLAAGTPWFQRIIGHKFSPGQINITVRDAILSVDGVASIKDIVSVRGSAPRSADIRVTVLTTQGAEVIIEAEVP